MMIESTAVEPMHPLHDRPADAGTNEAKRRDDGASEETPDAERHPEPPETDVERQHPGHMPPGDAPVSDDD